MESAYLSYDQKSTKQQRTKKWWLSITYFFVNFEQLEHARKNILNVKKSDFVKE